MWTSSMTDPFSFLEPSTLHTRTGVRGGHRLGAGERSAGELESGLGWRDGQETTMGLSLGLLSRMGLVRWLPAWEGVSPGSFIGREFEKKTKFSPSCKGSYIIYRVMIEKKPDQLNMYMWTHEDEIGGDKSGVQVNKMSHHQ